MRIREAAALVEVRADPSVLDPRHVDSVETGTNPEGRCA